MSLVTKWRRTDSVMPFQVAAMSLPSISMLEESWSPLLMTSLSKSSSYSLDSWSEVLLSVGSGFNDPLASLTVDFLLVVVWGTAFVVVVAGSFFEMLLFFLTCPDGASPLVVWLFCLIKLVKPSSISVSVIFGEVSYSATYGCFLTFVGDCSNAEVALIGLMVPSMLLFYLIDCSVTFAPPSYWTLCAGST